MWKPLLTLAIVACIFFTLCEAHHHKCPKNEIYEVCLSCPARNCGVNIAAVSCLPTPNPGDPDCTPGCRCRDFYLRDGTGKCIPEKQCPKCPPNEVYDVCPAPCPPQRCDVDKRLISCEPPPSPGDSECEPGCRCEFDLVRNEDGICVTRDQCPPVCGKHEVYSNCTNGGRGPYYCSDVGYSTDSVIDPRYCTEGCVCKNGYVRDDDNNCIPISNCPSCGGDPNAESGCGTYCGQLCTDYNIGAVACSDVCNENGCACRKGYVYDQIVGKCVLPDDCSSPQCKKQHQVYDPCLQSCPPRTCESIGKIYFCPRSRKGNECVGGCRCKNGYYTNSIGECISEKNCLRCNGPNEYYSCGGACDNVCETLSQQNQTHCPIVNVKCNPMCYCNKGYARNASNICIPINQCPKPQCGVNEIYEECPDALCTPQYCSELGFPQPCPDIPDRCPGPPGCVCANGYVRNKKGRCIPKANCPSCGGDPNAVSGCGVCQKRCSNYNKGPIPCPRICLINACNCRKGFVLDDNTGKCVRPEKCSPICGEDEVYSDCIQGGCEARNCSQLGRPIPCVKIDSKYCIKGCVCKEGTLRNDDGICVPEDQCNQCNGPHEYYDSCAPTCPPQTCESIGKVYHCPRAPQVCKGACRCEKGYFRNKIGDCISKANCLKCKGPHEYFSCGGACDNVCATLSEQNQTNCPIVNIKCNPMCYCEEGYARDDSNTCIPIDQCPPPTCPVGERLEQCPTTLCAPQSCSQLGYPVPCDPIISDDSSCPGPPTCVCDNDLVRDDDGNCVSRQECPSCGGDPNAVSGCGVNCGRRCSNYNKKPGFCPLYCNLNGCDCKKGFVFDDNLKICVHPDDCTPTCSHNEVWDTCSNGGCNKRDCSEVDQPKICRDPITCIGGCVCQDGYLRADNGSCIPGDQCPESECPNQNEHYDPCPYDCSPGTCDTIGKSYSCPAQIKCNPACVCDRDYYKNSIGECISEEDCLKCTGPNEYFSCGGACDNVCATLNEQNQTNCPIVNIVCNPMCYCIDGYARDDNNNCVPINECPPPTCSENERLEQCPAALCTPQSCSQLGFPVPCNPITSDNSSCPGPPACVCDNDLVRDDYGNCVPKQECPSCGGDPNAVSGCGVNCGRRCSNYNGDPGFCPLYCNPNGCDCKEDFVFDDNLKICVLPDDCTPTCSYEEVWDTCSNGGCDKRDCSQLDQPKICRDPITCIGACVCKEGYLRADNGSCIPGDQCPESVCSNQNEHYDPCPYECSPGTCDTIGKSYSCPAHIKCNPSCVCDKDYYKNSIGQCISAEDCLKCGPDEYFTCGGACDNICSTLATRNQTHCPIRHKRCHYKCYCNEGYARDDNDVCIPIEQCGVTCAGDPNAVPGCGINCGRHCSDPSSGPVFCPDICLVGGCDCKENYVFDDNLYKCVLPGDCSPVCGTNEVYNKCINGGCNKKNCADLSLPSVCKHPRTCKEGCICADGYLRDGNGTCVPEDQCPSSCNGDINARPGCGVNCGRHCSNYNRDVACIDICYENACDCKDDYVYDDNTGMCVLPCDCTPICGANEVYDQCSNGGCVRRNCSELSEPIICKDVIECIGDCVCADGFLRNDDGVCVAENECRPMCSDERKPDNGTSSPSTKTTDSNDNHSPAKPVDKADAQARLNRASIAVSGEFMYQMAKSKPGSNFVASPTSLLIPIAQIALFAVGKVSGQLLKFLNLKNKDEIRAIFPDIIENYDVQQNIDFNVATKFYANENYPISEDFKKESKEYFNAGGENVDFANSQEAAKIINDWVNEETRGKIQNLISPDSLSADTRVVLCNAIYYLGDWLKQFKKDNTKTKEFYKGDNTTVQLPIMYQQNTFKYAENDSLGIQALLMNYKNNNFSFLCILPKENDGLLRTIEMFRNPDVLPNVIASLTSQIVQVSLPKMEIATNMDVGEMLKKDNVTEMFNPNSNGFKGILQNDEPIYVSSVVQDAKIKVNEKGTEAAAATGITGTATAGIFPPPPVYIFEATHPYIFFLLFDENPLFCGAFVGAE